MSSRKNGEKKYLDILQGWIDGEGYLETATAIWHLPKDRQWGEWYVTKTSNAEMKDMVELALIKHGNDPDAPGKNITTGQIVQSWEK